MYTKIKVNLVMCCGWLLGCGKGIEMKFLMRNYTMNSYGKYAWVDGAPYLHSWKLNVIQEFVCLLVQWHTFKNQDTKKSPEASEKQKCLSHGGCCLGTGMWPCSPAGSWPSKVLLDVVSTGVISAAQRPKAQGLHECRSPRQARQQSPILTSSLQMSWSI